MFRLAPPIRKLLLGLTLSGLLPLAALTAVSIYSAHEDQHRDAERATLDLARAVASAAEAELAASVWTLQALATSDSVLRGDLRVLHSEVARFAAVRDDVAAISLADSQGQVLLRSSEPYGSTPRQALEPSTLARTAATRTPQVGPLVKGPRGEYVYPVRVPVVVEGTVKYVLTAGLRPLRLKQILERQQRPSDWVVAVFDSQNRRVARSRDHDATLGGAPSPTLLKLLAANPAGEGVGATTGLGGEDFVTAFVRLPGPGWVVVIGSPTHAVGPLSSPTLSLYALGVGGSLLLSAWMAALLSRRIRDDIQHVVQQANRIGTVDSDSAYRPHTAEVAALMEQVRIADKRVRDALDSAARAGAAKDQFLAVLGHELRNPLAPISNVLLLLDRKAGESTARERAILRRQVRHMTRLVDDLLDVARLVEGKLNFKREAVELTALVTDVADTFRQQEPAARLEVSIPADRCVVHADAIRIAQVITNLLVNAYRHSAGKPIRLEMKQHAAGVEVAVRDQGDGMAPETVAGLFQPFYQAHANAGSLGLGLAIVKGIVEQHGGSVQAESPGLGHGSSFSFTLSLKDAATDAAPRPSVGTPVVASS